MSDERPPFRFAAHGVEFASTFALPGFDAGRDGPGPVCRLTTAATLPSPGDGAVLREWQHADGARFMAVVEAPGGYLLDVPGSARFLIAADGGEVACAAARDGGWLRILQAQVLPMVAVLRGFEVLHASGIALGGRAFALSAPSGTGKTTLTAQLVRDGAEFLADDVVAVELAAGGAVLAHAASRVAFADAAAAPGATEVEGFGERAVALREHDAVPAAPLAALYLLERAPAGEEPTVAEVEAMDPIHLMQTSFSLALRDPGRRRRQLDAYAAIEARARICAVRVPEGRVAEAAEVLGRHARDLAGEPA